MCRILKAMFATTINTLYHGKGRSGELGMLYTMANYNCRLLGSDSCFLVAIFMLCTGIFVLFIKVLLVTGLNEMVEWDMEWNNTFTFVGAARLSLSYLIHS